MYACVCTRDTVVLLWVRACVRVWRHDDVIQYGHGVLIKSSQERGSARCLTQNCV